MPRKAKILSVTISPDLVMVEKEQKLKKLSSVIIDITINNERKEEALANR